jgi:hypothetical protein
VECEGVSQKFPEFIMPDNIKILHLWISHYSGYKVDSNNSRKIVEKDLNKE